MIREAINQRLHLTLGFERRAQALPRNSPSTGPRMNRYCRRSDERTSISALKAEIPDNDELRARID